MSVGDDYAQTVRPRMALKLTEAVKASSSDPAAIEPATVSEALACIRAWRSLLQAVVAVAEAQVMAACWVIQRETADREAFDAAVRRVPDLPPARAWTMAETWAVARRQRAVRTLALDSPAEAVRFVSELASAVDTGDLTDDDREVAELLAAPPRKRQAQLRALVQMRRGAETSTASWARQQPLPVEPADPAEAPPRSPSRLLRRAEEIELAAADLARELARGGAHWTARSRDQLNVLLERCIVHLESCAPGEEAPGPEGGS